MSGYIEYDSDIPNMRSEFKLGELILKYLLVNYSSLIFAYIQFLNFV